MNASPHAVNARPFAMIARPLIGAALGLGIAIGLLGETRAEAGAGVAEPAGYRMEAYRAPVPGTLAGARVVDVAEARTLWEGGAVFVDVLPAPPRPDDLPEGTIWRTPTHATVPGATWLPNTGFGALAEATETYFKEGMAEARAAMPDGPVVIFCKRDCWMSWNAAKRAIAHGHQNVVWFPDGTDGWDEADLPMEDARARPGFQ